MQSSPLGFYSLPLAWFCEITEARSDLLALRVTFRRGVTTTTWDVPGKADLLEQLIDLLHDRRLTERVAKYVYVVLEVFSSMPMFIPAPYTYFPWLACSAVVTWALQSLLYPTLAWFCEKTVPVVGQHLQVASRAIFRCSKGVVDLYGAFSQ